MKIEAIDFLILKSEPVTPEWRPLRTMREYPNAHKVRFGHQLFKGEGIRLEKQPAYLTLLRIRTDTNLETCGIFSTGWAQEDLEWAARTFKVQWEPEILGTNALDREYMWHKMWMARRYFHMASTAPLALIDSLLWDLAGLHAQLPVHKLLGGFRNRVPAYLTETGIPYEDTLKSAQRAIDEGFQGFKDHSMLGVETNLALAKDIRDLVGDDMVLMHDPVQQYSVEDAIVVGRGLGELNYLWIEEPLQEFDINGLKRLSDAIDLPVMALESIQGKPLSRRALSGKRRHRHRAPNRTGNHGTDEIGQPGGNVWAKLPRRESPCRGRNPERRLVGSLSLAPHGRRQIHLGRLCRLDRRNDRSQRRLHVRTTNTRSRAEKSIGNESRRRP